MTQLIWNWQENLEQEGREIFLQVVWDSHFTREHCSAALCVVRDNSLRQKLKADTDVAFAVKTAAIVRNLLQLNGFALIGKIVAPE